LKFFGDEYFHIVFLLITKANFDSAKEAAITYTWQGWVIKWRVLSRLFERIYGGGVNYARGQGEPVFTKLDAFQAMALWATQ
jgi:hypothetical protein